MAEAHNSAGNDAFNAGDFPKAVTLYYEAVKADGTVAKYRTNLCNALLKSGRYSSTTPLLSKPVCRPVRRIFILQKRLSRPSNRDVTISVVACCCAGQLWQ